MPKKLKHVQKYGLNIDLNRLYRLFKQPDGRIIELGFSRGDWLVSFGELANFSISAARQHCRRKLNSLCKCDLIAVGVFKVSLGQTTYRVFLHLILSGATIAQLKRAFSYVRPDQHASNMFQAKEANSVARAIKNLLKLDARRQHYNRAPSQSNGSTGGGWSTINLDFRPTEQHRREYREWLATLARPGLLFRHGCDRHFKKVAKMPRKIQLKMKKKHRYPYWLEPFWFGSPRWDNEHSILTKGTKAGPEYFDIKEEE
jgi:hypothetical protein